MTQKTADEIREAVSAAYGARAKAVAAGETAGCCGDGCCGTENSAAGVKSLLYSAEQAEGLPETAVSYGCGNPVAIGTLRPGEVVLDLGSGAGLDCFLAARQVGSFGRVFGLDMTDDMLALARKNAEEAGVKNVEFLRGRIEDIPLPSASVDVIISNCVVNLSGDKRKVIEEAFRVLKPGGRFAVSDVVVEGELPEDVKRSMELWVGCVAGALSDEDFITLLRDAGFENPTVEFTRTYDVADAKSFLVNTGVDADRIAREVAGRIGAAFVRATKPLPVSATRAASSRSCGCSDDCCA